MEPLLRIRVEKYQLGQFLVLHLLFRDGFSLMKS